MLYLQHNKFHPKLLTQSKNKLLLLILAISWRGFLERGLKCKKRTQYHKRGISAVKFSDVDGNLVN